MASDRFDYQKNWALVRLLSLHRDGGDYVLLCEFHEDVTVINSPSSPTTATFYQVKTDGSKPWTVKRLINQGKSKKSDGNLPSILGKLCAKAESLHGQGASFQFVTNSGFSFKSVTGSPTTLSNPAVHLASSLLHPDEWSVITSALHKELGIDLGGYLKDNLSLSVADLPLQMHSKTALGIVSEFLEEFAPGCAIVPGAFYRTLFDELKRRTVAAKPAGALPLICKAKGIDRMTFNAMMKGAIKVAPTNSAWPAIQQELQHDGVPLKARLDLNEASKSYYVRSLSTTDSALRRDRRLLISEAEKQLFKNLPISLLELAKAAFTDARNDISYGSSELTEQEALVLIMVELYERQHDEVSDADAQLEGEDA